MIREAPLHDPDDDQSQLDAGIGGIALPFEERLRRVGDGEEAAALRLGRELAKELPQLFAVRRLRRTDEGRRSVAQDEPTRFRGVLVGRRQEEGSHRRGGRPLSPRPFSLAPKERRPGFAIIPRVSPAFPVFDAHIHVGPNDQLKEGARRAMTEGRDDLDLVERVGRVGRRASQGDGRRGNRPGRADHLRLARGHGPHGEREPLDRPIRRGTPRPARPGRRNPSAAHARRRRGDEEAPRRVPRRRDQDPPARTWSWRRTPTGPIVPPSPRSTGWPARRGGPS